VRRSVLALCVVLSVGTLTGCSGGGPYCEAVDEAKATFTTFDQRTRANFEANADAATAVAKVAPDDVRKQWRQIAKATRQVVKAQQKAGIALEDLKAEEKVNALSRSDIDRLDQAFAAFNDTKEQREDVVRNVRDECGIDLSEQ